VDIEGLRRKADAGNLAAQSILGICYLGGIDVTVDYDKAFELGSER
jgi:TPR repeat protein